MSDSGSVTRLLQVLIDSEKRDKRGEAESELCKRYFKTLAHQAESRLRGTPVASEGDDVALSAINAVIKGIESGAYSKMDSRENLWGVLFGAMRNTVCNLVRDANAVKRGRGAERVEPSPDSSDPLGGLAVSQEPDPAEAAASAEAVSQLLEALDPELQRVALLKLEGCLNKEIANELQCSVQTVERRLGAIRDIWEGSDTDFR
jgi:RNA polymerase sigma factor (sigma-70 family)